MPVVLNGVEHFVAINEQVDEVLLEVGRYGLLERPEEIFDPDLGIAFLRNIGVYQVLLNHLVDAVANQELLVVQSLHNGGHQPHVVLALTNSDVQYNLDYSHRYGEQLAALVHEVVLQGRDVQVDLGQYRQVVLVYLYALEHLFCMRHLFVGGFVLLLLC